MYYSFKELYYYWLMGFVVFTNEVFSSPIEMAIMTLNLTRHTPYDFARYGRYCGLGSKKLKPVDEIDSCCMIHDNCYANLEKPCGYPLMRFYKFHILPNEKRPIICELSQSPCRFLTCQCDVELSICLRKYDHLYQEKNVRWFIFN